MITSFTRDVPGSINLSTTPIAASIDTVFYDTLFGNPSTNLIGWPDLSIGNLTRDTSSAPIKYRYRVTIRNKSNQEGLPYNFADIDATNPILQMQIVSPMDAKQFQSGNGITIIWNKFPLAKDYQIKVLIKSNLSDTILSSITSDTAIALPMLSIGTYYACIKPCSSSNQWGFWCIPRKFQVTGNLFSVVFGDSLHSKNADCIIKTNDGGYLLAGEISPKNTYNPNAVILIKTDSLATEQWQLSYSLSGIGKINCVLQSEDMSYMVLGTSWNDQTFLNEAFVLRISSSGALIWKKLYSQPLYNQNGETIIATPDNEYIIGAAFYPNGINLNVNGSINYSKAHLIKINTAGDVQWEQFTDSIGAGPNLIPNSNNFVSFCFKTGVLDGVVGEYNITNYLYMHVFDYLGNLLWSKQISVPDAFYTIRNGLESNSGEYILLSNPEDVPIPYSFIKISPDGTLLSTPYLHQTTATKYCFQFATDGGFILASGEGVITKLDADENQLWQKTYADCKIASFIVETDGSLVLTGSRNGDVLLLKTNKDGASFEE